jgi:thioredoxin
MTVSLILAPAFSITAVRKKMDELEQIRTRKIAEMMSPKSSPQSGSPAELTDASFDSAVGANSIVVVDCWAAWCYPCRMIAPIMEELAAEYSSVAMFAKLNVDENTATAIKHGIQSIPTILIIKNGVEVERIVGTVPREHIEAVLKKHL